MYKSKVEEHREKHDRREFLAVVILKHCYDLFIEKSLNQHSLQGLMARMFISPPPLIIVRQIITTE